MKKKSARIALFLLIPFCVACLGCGGETEKTEDPIVKELKSLKTTLEKEFDATRKQINYDGSETRKAVFDGNISSGKMRDNLNEHARHTSVQLEELLKKGSGATGKGGAGSAHSTDTAPPEPVPTPPPVYEEPPPKEKSLLDKTLAQLARGEEPDLSPLQLHALLAEMEAKRGYWKMLEQYGDYFRNRAAILVLETEKKKKELERDLKNLDKKPEEKPVEKKKDPAAILVPAEPVPVGPPNLLPPDPFQGCNPSMVPIPVTWMGRAQARGNLYAGYEDWNTGEVVRYHERHQPTPAPLPVNFYAQDWRNPRNIGHMEDKRAYLQPSWNRWRYAR